MSAPTSTQLPVQNDAERRDIEAMRDWHVQRDSEVWGRPVRRAMYERRSDAVILKLTEMEYPGGVAQFLVDRAKASR